MLECVIELLLQVRVSIPWLGVSSCLGYYPVNLTHWEKILPGMSLIVGLSSSLHINYLLNLKTWSVIPTFTSHHWIKAGPISFSLFANSFIIVMRVASSPTGQLCPVSPGTVILWRGLIESQLCPFLGCHLRCRNNIQVASQQATTIRMMIYIVMMIKREL